MIAPTARADALGKASAVRSWPKLDATYSVSSELFYAYSASLEA